MGRTSASCSAFVCLVATLAVAPGVTAHDEEPGSARKYTLARGDLPGGGRYHWFVQKATLQIPEHTHLGRGRDVCDTLDRIPGGWSRGCGRPSRRRIRGWTLALSGY